MRKLAEIIPEIADILASANGLENVRILPEYKGSAISVPINFSAVAVGLAGVTPFEDIIGNYEGTDSDGRAFAARSSRVIVRFSIYTPPDSAGIHDIDIAAAIGQILLSSEAEFTFSGCEIGEVKFDKSTGGLARIMTAEMQVLLEI